MAESFPPEFVASAKERFRAVSHRKKEFSDINHQFGRLHDQLKIREHELAFEATVLKTFLQEALPDEEMETICREIESSYLSPINADVSLDEILRLIAPGYARAKRLTGEELLRAIARGMVKTNSPMNFSEMIAFLDENGFERPGANYRNNLISMVTKAPHIFHRVGRGIYDVTPEARSQAFAELSEEERT